MSVPACGELWGTENAGDFWCWDYQDACFLMDDQLCAAWSGEGMVAQLTLEQGVEGPWSWQIGCDCNIILAGGFHLDMHGAVGIAAEAAHLASREGHVGQAAKAVISERENVMKPTASTEDESSYEAETNSSSHQPDYSEKNVLSLFQTVLTIFGLMRRKSQLLAEKKMKQRLENY